MIQIVVRNQNIRCVKSWDEHITAGLVGKEVFFEFPDEWASFAKTAVFTAGDVTKDKVLSGNQTTIPPECLIVGEMLRIGVFATDGTIQTPTIYTKVGRVEPGADPSGDESTDPTLPVWAQLQAMIGNLGNLSTEAKGNLVAAINEAAKTGSGSGGGSVSMQVKDGYIQYSADEGKTWRNLITLAELTGPAGPAGGKGDQGEQGPQGIPGPAYELTEADKQEIVEDVLAEVPSGGGSGGVSDYTELTNKPQINGVELSGNKTSADLGIGEPTDEQVSTAVSTWLDEHPEATTTVAKGSITPEKLSFYDDSLSYIALDSLEYSEAIKGDALKALGLWYDGHLSEHIPTNSADHCYLKTYKRAGQTSVSAYVNICPIFYGADGTALAVGNTADVYQYLGSYSGPYQRWSTFSGFHIPAGCEYMRIYKSSSGNTADVTLFFNLNGLIPAKPWENETTDEIKEQWGVIDGVYGNLLNLDADNMLGLGKPSDFKGFYEIPNDFSGVLDGKTANNMYIFLDPIETRGRKDIYCRFSNGGKSNGNWALDIRGFLLYDKDMNYIGQLPITDGVADGVAECKRVYYADQGYMRHFFHLSILDDRVAYAFFCGDDWEAPEKWGCASYSPFDISIDKNKVESAELAQPVIRRMEQVVSDNEYYRFRQIGRLVDQGDTKYVAWNHNRMHYDKTRDMFVMAFRGSNSHGGSTKGAFFATITPLTYKASAPSQISDGTNTIVGVNGFVVDDSGNYLVFGPIAQGSADIYKFVSSDGGKTWTNSGKITVDVSGAADADATKYNYSAFYSMYRLSDGTLLASYDDPVCPVDKTYGFVARSVDEGMNWTVIEVLPASSDWRLQVGPVEQCFFEIDGTVISIGRVNRYNIYDRSIPYHAVLMYSNDSGATWTGYGYSDRIENHCQTVACFEHDGIVEVLAMSRNTSATATEAAGKIYHYSCSKEEALNDGFKLREVFYSQSKSFSDFAGIAVAQDKYGNVLAAYSDSTPTSSTITSPHFMIGASGGVHTPCCDGFASNVLPYSGEKIEAIVAELKALINA